MFATLKRHRRLAVVALTLTLIVIALILSRLTRITPHVRDAAVAGLEDRFKGDVELDTLQVSMFPKPEVLGTGLRVRLKETPKVTPMIRVESYSASAGLWGLVTTPVRLRTVELEGLAVTLQPRPRPAPGDSRKNDQPKPVAPAASPSKARLVIDEVVARKATLEILSRDEGKLPRVFEIHDLVMHGLGDGGGSSFGATLTNWKPRGEITTHGKFGPWRSDEPRQTPLQGEYVFKAANLNTIKGIAGMLSSTGNYSGVLERIEVTGTTDTPDFSIDVVGRPVHLKTKFDAVVDGTNGDTWLERVEATLGETLIVARGAVVRAQDVKGRKTSLDVQIDNGRLEDILKLGVKTPKPIMTGRMRLKTTFLLPAGDRDVLEKLVLSGTFALDQARFTNMDVQQRINVLSQRGKGKNEKEANPNGPSVVSRLSGRFLLRNGTLTFSDLSFGVPGAVVQIAGTYNIRREELDFKGHLLLDSNLAETTTGIKSVLAWIAQPLFRRPGGGSKIPIKILGSREKPEFGLDVRRALGPG